MEKRKRVSEVARELGVSEHWLRLAEKTGKIPKARRDINGWRVYYESDIARLGELLTPSNGTEENNEGGS